jgi:hypothetical protein
MTSIKTLIVAVALVTSGTAYANETVDSLSRAVTESRTAFSAKSTVQRNDFTGSVPVVQIRANVQTNNAFPVNTMNLSNGSTN